MKEQNIFHKTVTSRSFKGNSQPLGLPLYKLLRFFLIIFVPADDLTSRIDEKWSLKRISFRPDKRIIPVTVIIILQKAKPRLVPFIQGRRFFCIPEHIVISSQQDFSSRELRNKIKIFLCLRQFSSPGMIARDHKRVFPLNHFAAVFCYFFLMFFPDFSEPVHRLVYRKSQMHISKRI